MTIAAAFRFDKGILICADTQYSGSLKMFDTKLHHHMTTRLGGSDVMHTFLAMSGTDGYLQMTETKISDAISELAAGRRQKEANQDTVRDVITEVMIDLHQDHLYKHPFYGYQGGPSISVIAAIWMEGWSAPAVYWTLETSVVEMTMPDYALVGSGSEMAKFALTPLFSPDTELDLDHAALIATHALRIAKDYDPNCGGISEFAALYNDGTYSHIAKFDISTAEAYSQTFEEIVRDLFFVAANIDDPQRKTVLRIANERLRKIRKEQKASIERRRRLEEALKGQNKP